MACNICCEDCHLDRVKVLKDRERLAGEVGGTSCTDEDEGKMLSAAIGVGPRRPLNNQLSDAIKRCDTEHHGKLWWR